MSKVLFAFITLQILISLTGSASKQDITAETLAVQSSFASNEQTDTYADDLQLAERYEPVFYFHPDEVYLPQPVDVVMGISRLRQSKHLWFDTTLLNSFTAHALFTQSSDETFFLDQWFGDIGSSEYANYSSHKAVYQSSISPEVGGPQPLIYAHIMHNIDPEYTSIQYWIFYFYNDWFNKHEGDWEMVEVILLAGEQPGWVIYGQHHGGVRRSWATTPVEGGTHPAVYVARGSHANYFAGGEVYVYVQDIGNRQLILVDRTGASNRLLPQITLLPTRAELSANPEAWPGVEWLSFRGRWGETAVYGDFNGPYGPADKGTQWDDPYTWGIGQPLDRETWYKNRLRIEITGPDETQAQIWITDAIGQKLVGSESIGNLALLHSEPPEKVLVKVEGSPSIPEDITVYWPDSAGGTVTRTLYSGLMLDTSGHAQLEISADHVISVSSTAQLSLIPRQIGSYKEIWDAPDSVLVSSTLPIQDILAGLLLSLLISLVPVILLVAILYWVDQYQKGPIKLFAVAFSWGAIPALLVAFSVQLFFKIPANLMGSSALEAIRLGILAPVVEEILKAAGILFIYWRFRRDINDVLDGIFYGAVVGFGFAFISNLFRYTGDFFSLGFPALNLSFVALRTVHVLNHGLYTAIFGAFLGFASQVKSRRRFWTLLIGGLVSSIATHALQNLLSNNLVGLNAFTVVVTIAGTLVLWVVGGWSLVQQRRLLRTELQGLVHETLYTSIQHPLVRLKTQWQALRHGGFRAWLHLRRLQGLCIHLARLRLQARLHPEKISGLEEAEALQAEIARTFIKLNLADS